MTIDTPENNKPLDTEASPDDQTGTPDATATATVKQVTLASLVASHETTHPGFDASIHATNDDGTPKRRADGSYALKRGRKAGQTSNLPPKTPGATSATAAAPVVDTGPVKIAPDEAARQSANLIVNLAVWICGEEIGKPQDKAEAEGLKISFVNYYEARGVPNIPPELGLIAALGSYIVPRFRASEKARGLIERAVIYVKSKLGK